MRPCWAWRVGTATGSSRAAAVPGRSGYQNRWAPRRRWREPSEAGRPGGQQVLADAVAEPPAVQLQHAQQPVARLPRVEHGLRQERFGEVVSRGAAREAGGQLL